MNAKELREQAENLFGKRSQLLCMWQEIAYNFYPTRAHFTVKANLGEDFASGLATSYPLLVQRDLGNTLGSMLRPTSQPWFHTRVADARLDSDIEARQWLEWAEGVQRRAMYDPVAQFTRATKEGDHDYSAFGQCVISVEMNRRKAALLYRCWHLRDVVWFENSDGAIGGVFRKWKPTARTLRTMFPATADSKIWAEKDPFCEYDCYHMVVESDMYDNGRFKTPYVSIYYDCTHNKVLEEVGCSDLIYVVPRWQTVSDSQYAYSPATVAGLPEARLLQAMTSTLLEAGEKMTNPPMIAVQEAIRSDIDIQAGGVTWVDAAYDERMGEVFRPMTLDRSGMPIGMDMQKDSRAVLMEAFYLNKFGMPPRNAEMTAFEVSHRVQEYIRQALPIFEPMEQDYNGQLCNMTFTRLQENGAYGDPRAMPRMLRERDVTFTFVSPLHDAIEADKGNRLGQAIALTSQVTGIDPRAAKVLDFTVALRDALLATVPANWQRTPEVIAQIEEAENQQAATASLLQQMQAGADVAKTAGEAASAFAGAQTE